MVKNYIQYMTIGVLADSYPLVQIDDHSATDASVNFTDHSSNFRLKFGNGSRFVHINL